ncbi:MAG: hybrid sensor histidine kinase/response regulator [Rhodanobacter sp.]|nr:hybrid sensor histidine kinase/response regulator [Rhodanobacter sp.]
MTDEWSQKILEEEIGAIFRGAIVGIGVSTIAALVLAVFMLWGNMTTPWRGSLWTGGTLLCSTMGLWLTRQFHRSPPPPDALKNWAYAFTVICLFGGATWGMASTYLVSTNEFVVVILIHAAVLGVCACAIPAYSTHLPTYLAFLLSANLPFILINFNTTKPLLQLGIVLLGFFVVAMGWLGVISNRSFNRLVLLRLKTEKLANDLDHQRKLAEEASRSKSSFLAAASHDLRQPVHALSLLVGALDTQSLAPPVRALVAQMEESITVIASLFDALLDISKLDAGVIEVRPQAFRIDPIMRRVANEYLAEASAKGLALSMVSTTAAVRSDPVLLERILRNLVSNAVKHTGEGRVLMGCLREKSHLRVLVLDTGPGIPPEEYGRIFTEFYQLNNPERDRTKGLGLGLAIVRRLANLLAYPLLFKSRVGHGSSFGILVPRADSAEEVMAIADESTGPLFTTGFFVVIDDESAIRDAMSTLLMSWGHRVIIAASGDDALKILADIHERPDLIVCDYRLHAGENGIDVIMRIRSEYNIAIPSLLISGDTAPERLAEAKASGLLLLHKPIPNSQLRAAINNLLHLGPQDL